MKTTREVAHQQIRGVDRILAASGILVFACAIYLAMGLKYHLHTARPLAGLVSALLGPVCFLLAIRELARYRRSVWSVTAVATSGMAVAIAWLATVLFVSGRFI
jgi:hypothetical protein